MAAAAVRVPRDRPYPPGKPRAPHKPSDSRPPSRGAGRQYLSMAGKRRVCYPAMCTRSDHVHRPAEGDIGNRAACSADCRPCGMPWGGEPKGAMNPVNPPRNLTSVFCAGVPPFPRKAKLAAFAAGSTTCDSTLPPETRQHCILGDGGPQARGCSNLKLSFVGGGSCFRACCLCWQPCCGLGLSWGPALHAWGRHAMCHGTVMRTAAYDCAPYGGWRAARRAARGTRRAACRTGHNQMRP